MTQVEKKSSKNTASARKSKAERMRVLRIKRAALIAVMVAIVITVFFIIRFAMSALRPKASETTLTLNSNGTVRLEEVIDLSAYKLSKSDIKSQVNDSIKDFNDKSKDGKVSLKRVSEVKNKTYLETAYDDIETYASFTGYSLYNGKVSKAEKKGLDFNNVFFSVKDGKKGKALEAEKVKALDCKLLTVNENLTVKVPGEVVAVSGDNTKIKDKDLVKISPLDNESDSAAVTYIFYK